MKKNLVIAAAVGLDVDQITLFVKSLRKYYYEDICIVIGHKDFALEEELEKYKTIILKTKIHKKSIQFERYKIFLNFLEKRSYDNILCTDSRDVYFQANPFNFQYKGEINFFLEDKKIKECPFNTNWIIKTYGKNKFENIKDKVILCSGTVLGKHEKIKEYLRILNNQILKFKYKRKLKYSLTFRPDPEGRGCDQGHANYLVHNNMIKNFYFYSNKIGPVATVFHLNEIIFNEDNELINTLNDSYIIVHQYDKKWNEFKSNVNQIRLKLGLSQIL